MQLSKPFNFEDNSLFNEHIMPDEHIPRSSPSPKHQQADSGADIHTKNAGNLQNPARQMRYFQEYKKIYDVSYHLYLEKMRLIDVWKQATRKINALEERLRNREEKESKKMDISSQQNKIKRSRRTAQMIEKKFRCSVTFCERLYGSQGSLQQHIKLKHPQLYRAPDNGSQAYSEDFNDSI